VNADAILALISDLYTQVSALTRENEALRQTLAARPAPEPSASPT
jgi:hypothetical protein